MKQLHKPGASQEPVPLGTPTYYEVWGGLESANRALWVALWFSITVAIAALLLLRLTIRRPPVVIRVADSGQAQVVANPGRQPPVSEAEIKNFLSLFERFFTELNVHTFDSDLKAAFSMMTQSFQAKADAMLKREGIVDALKAGEIKTTLFLTELKVVKDTEEIVECKVKGYRQTKSFKPEGPTGEVVFEHDIVLRKVPRSELAPYGLLVEDWLESTFKK